jgi:hypothetical protein
LRLPFSIAYDEGFISSPTRTSVSTGVLQDDLQPSGKIVPSYFSRDTP